MPCSISDNHSVPETPQPRNITLAITGASGSIYAAEFLRAAAQDDRIAKINLVVSENALRVLAEELHLSVKTVETYQAHIKEKLALRSGRELIQHAIQWKISEKSA